MEELGDVGRRNWLLKSIFTRRLTTRHVERPKQDIEQRQVSGKVLVTGFKVRAVMPAMKLRRGPEATERPKVDAQVGVNNLQYVQ